MWNGSPIKIAYKRDAEVYFISNPTHASVITDTEKKKIFTYQAIHLLKQWATCWKDFIRMLHMKVKMNVDMSFMTLSPTNHLICQTAV